MASSVGAVDALPRRPRRDPPFRVSEQRRGCGRRGVDCCSQRLAHPPPRASGHPRFGARRHGYRAFKSFRCWDHLAPHPTSLGRQGADPPCQLTQTRRCLTLYDMKTSALTIRLDPELDEQLDRLARESGRSRSDLARDALRRQLAVLQFEQARRQIMPFAEARGYLTDEDVFDSVS